jgi:hypothetical protein
MVLFALGLEQDFLELGEDDVLEHKLQDAGLLTRERAPKQNKKKKEGDGK